MAIHEDLVFDANTITGNGELFIAYVVGVYQMIKVLKT